MFTPGTLGNGLGEKYKQNTQTHTDILGIDALVLLLRHHILGKLDMRPCANALIQLIHKLDPELNLGLDSGLCALGRDASDVDSETMCMVTEGKKGGRE